MSLDLQTAPFMSKGLHALGNGKWQGWEEMGTSDKAIKYLIAAIHFRERWFKGSQTVQMP